MEPPAKRPRLGISPYKDNRDEVEDDELNLQPEQVNALRDPGYQLEKSRAVAANRLKSAFERIFEKYEKDFTGIGDEINLETGEVEVDNGHIQSLEDAIVGDEDDEEDGDDEDSMNEEERLLQGKPSKEKRSSRIGENGSSPLKSLVRPLGQPQPWAADPPRISSMFGPPRPPFGSFSAGYEIPGGMETLTDPTWKAPQLPVVETYVDPAWKTPDLPPPKPPTPRLPMLRKKLLTTGTVDEEDDDILTGASTTPLAKLRGHVSGKMTKKPSPSQTTQGSTRGANGTVSKSTSKRKENEIPKAKEATEKRVHTTKNPGTDSSVKPRPRSASNPRERTQTKAPEQIQTVAISSKQLVAVKRKRSSDILPSKREGPDESFEPEVYIDVSSGKAITTKPNQKLSVDIVIRKKLDTSLYKIVPAEPSGDQSTTTPAEGQKEDVSQGLVAVPEEGRLEAHQQKQESLYARNVVDSSFAFSDEEEPALPKPKPSKRRGGRPRKHTSSTVPLDASKVPQPQEVSPEQGAGSASVEEAREVESRTKKTNAVTGQDASMEVEATEAVAGELYTRNAIDSRFTFSDEEDSALPKVRVRAGPLRKRKQPQTLAPANAPAPTTVDVLSTSFELSNGEPAASQASTNEPPTLDETNEVPTQESVTEDPVNASDANDTSNDSGSVIAIIDHDASPAPVGNSKSPVVVESNTETNELPAEADTTHEAESTPYVGSSEANLEQNKPPAETYTVQQPGPTPRSDTSEPNLEKGGLPADPGTVQPSESTPQIGSLEPNLGQNEPPAKTDTVPLPEPTLHNGSSESPGVETTEVVEDPPIRLLQMKPRRKRKVSMAFTEESLPSPMGPEGDKPTETFITAPSKRLKRSRLSQSVNASDFVGQQEEQTVQLDAQPHEVNDITIPETSPMPPPPPVESTLPERATASAKHTIPESSPLIQPAFNSSLMGIVEDLVQLDDAVEAENDINFDDNVEEPENNVDFDFDDPPAHPTPIPDLPSPELGEDATVPETSPLPYSSPSKAVKAVKKPKPKPKPKLKPPPQPSTPVNRKAKQKQKEAQKHVSVSPAPSTEGLLSLVPDGGDDDNEIETDELSLTPRRYYTPPSVRQSIAQQDPAFTDKHTSLTGPLLRMKLLSSSKKGIRNIPKTPSQAQTRRRTLMAPINNENQKPSSSQVLPSSVSTSRMYFSADRRPSTSTSTLISAGTGGVKRRRSGAGARQAAIAISRIPKFVQPSAAEEDDDTVLTPGGTKRRCGEDGFHCDRDFCFVCL